jgi:hypothetical protein
MPNGTPRSNSRQQAALARAANSPMRLYQDLSERRRVTTPFPPCADEMLALIRSTESDEITRSFNDYFSFCRNHTLGELWNGTDIDEVIGNELDDGLRHCHTLRGFGGDKKRSGWPSDCCICEPCVTLDGNRDHPDGANAPLPPPGIRRLFSGDALWLFYYDQMGVHQILGAILDAFAGSGRLPISNGSLPQDTVRDNIAAVILEIMVRQTKTGMSSGVRDRASLYRTTLGWNTKIGSAMGVDSEVNSGFSTLFHRFIFNALEYYRDKRLAIAIQSTNTPRASVATLVTLQNTIDILTKRFEPFDYGRNHYNTLAGIVWTISGMSIIRHLRGTLGIPTAFDDPYEFIPAAYDLLVLKRPVTRGDINRYSIHRDCAVNGRDILLDLEVLDHSNTDSLQLWLDRVEGKIEAYRTAYRNLTGTDLGASSSPMIEHQVPVTA